MKKIVLIGGGNIGRADTKYETKEIDEEIVKLSNKDNPNFLFIGLASEFSDSYYKVIKDIYKNLGCTTGKISNKTLKNNEVVEKKISEADIIYIGGGDTLRLMNIFKENKLDKMLDRAIQKGTVVAGISAGAISLCKYGLSDTEIMNNKSDHYVKVNGLGFIDYMFVPHFISDSDKEYDLKETIKNTNITALCMENCTSLIIDNDRTYIIKSDKKAKVYKISHTDKYNIIDISNSENKE